MAKAIKRLINFHELKLVATKQKSISLPRRGVELGTEKKYIKIIKKKSEIPAKNMRG
jgi:hypothetical protein